VTGPGSRRRLLLYLLAVHLLAAGVLAWTAFRVLGVQRGWLLAIEALLLGSLLLGWRLLRRVFLPLELVEQGTQFLEDGELTSRMHAAQPELDRLARVYNRMVDHLRDERTRLAERHHFFSDILQVTATGIIILDFDGKVETVNPAAQALVRDLAPGQKPEAIAAPMGPTLAALAVGEARVIGLQGARRIRCWRGSFMDRGFSRSFFLLEELTEELRQAEKAAYEKLIRMMSHEVNNSVGASNSLLHSCLAYVPLVPADQRADLEAALKVVIARTEQLSSLMRGFADVVRLPPPQPRRCDLQPLLADIALLMRPESTRRNVEWRWEVQPPGLQLDLDRVQMEQVFVNVVKNALEAIGENGTITVRMGRRGSRPFVTIEDSGPGLSPEAQTQLFTPFFTTKENGQGIGLTLVQQILTQHHFDYSLESPPGGPTQFTILF
jgi:two-component system nitrogen regulation sensor histidine kinase NtrY